MGLVDPVDKMVEKALAQEPIHIQGRYIQDHRVDI